MDYQERETLRRRTASSNICLPLTLWEVIDRFAESRGMSNADVIAHLVRQGLRREAEQAKAAPSPPPVEASTRPKRRSPTLTPEQRERMAERMRQRWREQPDVMRRRRWHRVCVSTE